MAKRLEEDEPIPQRRRIKYRTSQLPVWSRILYKIEHYTVLPAVALVVTATVISPRSNPCCRRHRNSAFKPSSETLLTSRGLEVREVCSQCNRYRATVVAISQPLLSARNGFGSESGAMRSSLTGDCDAEKRDSGRNRFWHGRAVRRLGDRPLENRLILAHSDIGPQTALLPGRLHAGGAEVLWTEPRFMKIDEIGRGIDSRLPLMNVIWLVAAYAASWSTALISVADARGDCAKGSAWLRIPIRVRPATTSSGAELGSVAEPLNRSPKL